MKKTVNVYVHFDKVEETKEERLRKQAELFILLAQIRKGS